MSNLAFVLSIIFAFCLGWFWRDISDKVKEFATFLQSLKDLPEEQPVARPLSAIIEPRYETPSEKALREQKELTDSLNAPMS